MIPTNEPRIELILSTVGFKGRDLEELTPPFDYTERDVVVGMSWYRSATGPETWSLGVLIGVPLAVFLKKFGDLLAADLYAWSKEKLSPFFAGRPHNSGLLFFQLGDVEVYCWSPLEALKSEELIGLLQQMDPSKAKSWHLEVDQATKKFRVLPADPPSRTLPESAPQ